MLKKILARSEGQGLVEYSLILVLVAVVIVSVLSVLGPSVGNIFSSVLEHLVTDPGEPPPECYGSLLLPSMVGTTGLGVGLSYLWPKKPEPEAAV